MFSCKRLSLLLVLLIFAATWINPIWPYQQAMHSSATVVGLAWLWFYSRKRRISDLNYGLICLFIAAHCIAARWLYSYVPYDAWIQAVFGFSLQQTLGWTRNNFDRLVHVLYGFCFTPVLMEYFGSKYAISPRRGFVLAVASIMITGLCYEWFEWGLAMTMAPEYAEAYNGQQGDMWDPHKDMLMAGLGALAWFPKYLWRRSPRAD